MCEFNIKNDSRFIDPFVMTFDKSDPYQKSFARWINHKAIFKTVNWEEYNGKPRTK